MKKKTIRHRIRENIIRKAQIKNKRKVLFPSTSTLKSIGIICDAENHDTYQSNPLIKNTKQTILKIHKNKRPKLNNDMALYLSDKNFWGLPKKKYIKPFINKTFDILIDLSDGTNQAIEYICAQSLAGLKTGTNPNSRVYDLIINQNTKNSKIFIDELERTLNNLNQ